jgi:hypothetical protein
MEPKENNTDELLIDYALGQLDPDEQTRVELMLAERPELMREARALKRMASHMGVTMIMPPPRLVSRTRHAAHEARARRRGWRELALAALRRPVTAAAAALIIVAFVVALVGPSLWQTPPEEGLVRTTQAGTILPDLGSFLESNLGYMRALSRGEAPGVDDPSVPAGEAMELAKKPGVTEAQHAVLEDVEAVWRLCYKRVTSDGYLSGKTIKELKALVDEKRLVERLEALVPPGAGGR